MNLNRIKIMNEVNPDRIQLNPQTESGLSYDDYITKILKENKIPEFWLNKKLNQLKGDESFLDIIGKINKWDFKEPALLCILSNKNGCGKTHIAIALYYKFLYFFMADKINQNIDTKFFYKEYEIYSEIQSSYDTKTFSEMDLINEYSKKPFLIIDDLFASKENEFARTLMYKIIDSRIDWHRKPTVITSNLTFQEINNIDSRISSRLKSDLLIQLYSENIKDWRGVK